MKPTRTKRQAIRRIRRRIDKAGLFARAEAVLAAGQSAEFQHRLNAEVQGSGGDWVRTNENLRPLVLKILDQMQVDHRDIDVTFNYAPATRKLDMWAYPSSAAVRAIASQAKLRAVGPGERLPKS